MMLNLVCSMNLFELTGDLGVGVDGGVPWEDLTLPIMLHRGIAIVRLWARC